MGEVQDEAWPPQLGLLLPGGNLQLLDRRHLVPLLLTFRRDEPEVQGGLGLDLIWVSSQSKVLVLGLRGRVLFHGTTCLLKNGL